MLNPLEVHENVVIYFIKNNKNNKYNYKSFI